ncbi:hypothetical protein E4U40_004206 [Claviceps sp. LM458 group G5]|nr:hypothetical protein E4U40_004206 [Claviceps sp. LM458 group G5]
MTAHLVSLLVSLSAIVLIRFIFIQWRRCSLRRRLGCQKPPKYPHRLPWLLDPWGSDLQNQRVEAFAKGRYNRLYLQQFLKCGPTFEERSSHKGTLLCTTDDDNWRTILVHKAEDYCKEETRTGPMLRFIGPGILTNEGAAWRRSRNLIKPLFKRAELSDVMRFERHVDRLMKVLPRDGQTVDLMPWMAKVFLDSGTEFIFGQSFNCLAGDSTQADEMLIAFRACRRSLGKKRILASSKLPFFRDTEFERNVNLVHSFVDAQVARALEKNRDAIMSSERDEKKKALNNDDADGDRAARERYILLDELAKLAPDPIMLRHETLHVFLPAFLSISNIFSAVLFHLARSPDVWAELRTEALALGDEPLTFERLKSLHSFRDVFFEGLRVHGSSGRISRTAIRDTVIPRGGGPDGMSPVLVPKGRRVMLDMYAKFHDPQVWGEDADVFRPSRFEGRRLAWDFVPFSGGARICPAQQQAITQSIYLLVRLVKEFPIMENRDPCLEFIESMSLVSESRNGVLVGLGEKPASADAV